MFCFFLSLLYFPAKSQIPTSNWDCFVGVNCIVELALPPFHAELTVGRNNCDYYPFVQPYLGGNFTSKTWVDGTGNSESINLRTPFAPSGNQTYALCVAFNVSFGTTTQFRKFQISNLTVHGPFFDPIPKKCFFGFNCSISTNFSSSASNVTQLLESFFVLAHKNQIGLSEPNISAFFDSCSNSSSSPVSFSPKPNFVNNSLSPFSGLEIVRFQVNFSAITKGQESSLVHCLRYKTLVAPVGIVQVSNSFVKTNFSCIAGKDCEIVVKIAESLVNYSSLFFSDELSCNSAIQLSGQTSLNVRPNISAGESNLTLRTVNFSLGTLVSSSPTTFLCLNISGSGMKNNHLVGNFILSHLEPLTAPLTCHIFLNCSVSFLARGTLLLSSSYLWVTTSSCQDPLLNLPHNLAKNRPPNPLVPLRSENSSHHFGLGPFSVRFDSPLQLCWASTATSNTWISLGTVTISLPQNSGVYNCTLGLPCIPALPREGISSQNFVALSEGSCPPEHIENISRFGTFGIFQSKKMTLNLGTFSEVPPLPLTFCWGGENNKSNLSAFFYEIGSLNVFGAHSNHLLSCSFGHSCLIDIFGNFTVGGEGSVALFSEKCGEGDALVSKDLPLQGSSSFKISVDLGEFERFPKNLFGKDLTLCWNAFSSEKPFFYESIGIFNLFHKGFIYETTDWGPCSALCGGGNRARNLICTDGITVLPLSDCSSSTLILPQAIEPCNLQPCDCTFFSPRYAPSFDVHNDFSCYSSVDSSPCGPSCGSGKTKLNDFICDQGSFSSLSFCAPSQTSTAQFCVVTGALFYNICGRFSF